jgi:class 3 adenylate cyclase
LQPALTYTNATEAEQLFILERMAWSDQAVTAAEVTALQIFRDLFASEALRPHQQISVGSLTVVFTDLRGSTRLYREIGDAPAFGAVMSHFDVLRECVDEAEGALVKTLGDAIMAVFRRPAGALRAMLKAQHRLSHPPTGARPFLLKVGLHMGHCIAVNLNGRLDYFGSNVNIAARLEPLSDGSDIIISTAVRDDPKVAAMLSEPDSELQIEPIAATLKGLEKEQIELWRVRTRVRDEG